jgi:hypothetical protein
MGHTPGPWYANDECIESAGPEGPRDVTLAVVTHSADAHADARLIAAAPALLALVKRLREVFEELDDDWRVMDATRVDELIASDGLYACDQAIAKAEGGGDA